MKNKIKLFLIGFLSVFLLLNINVNVYAKGPTDEILNYIIEIEPYDDATLEINYHIDWLVLDDSIGALEWMKIGIPNRHNVFVQGMSPTVDSIYEMSDGGSYVRVNLDKNYYEGEVASVDFRINQDYMYQVDKLHEGFTEYSFTPGWFDDIAVDNLVIKWKSDKVYSINPSCFEEDGYYVWNTSLGAGEKFTVNVSYPNDALAFDLSKNEESGSSSPVDSFFTLIGVIIGIGLMFSPFIIIIVVVSSLIKYANGTGFNAATEKKITRTKVTYYPSCPGCGAVRKEGEQFCTYCGRSFVKSEEIIKEENVKAADKDILNFKKDGEYRYSSSPNTYVRVHTVVVPRPVTARSTTRSSCAHSSCAHSSCACACACACAGGGRAGCTQKDFYNTDLKLKQLELRLKAGK